MNDFNKGFKDRYINGETKDWVCNFCGALNDDSKTLKADMNSVIWCDSCIKESLKVSTIRYSYSLPGRNHPCVCGSEKKFKHCCIKGRKT